MYDKKFNKTVFSLIIVVTISKFIGMLRDSVLAYYFGTSSVSDAYIISSSVPVLIFYFIGHAISTSFIPMFTKIDINQGKKDAYKYTNSIINISLLFSILIICALMIFPSFIIKLFAIGFNEETIALSAKFVQLNSISLIFIVFIDIYSAILNIKGKFTVPASRSLVRNVMIIISIVVAYKFDVYFLSIGLALAYVMEFIYLIIFLRDHDYRYAPTLNLKDSNLRHTLFLVGPIVLSTGISQINKIIDKSIASTITIGGVSALNYASVINNAIQEILISGLIIILFANFANLAASKKYDEIRDGVNKTTKILIFILVPATIGLIMLSEDIVKLLFFRGAFNNDSLSMTSTSLSFYSIGLLFIAIKSVYIKVFYALNNTKIPTIGAILSIVINIILNLILSKFLGIPGLALATSVSMICYSLFMFIALRKKILLRNIKSTIRSIVDSMIASTMMVGGLLLMNYLLRNLNLILLSVAIKVLISVAIYLAMSILINRDTVIEIKRTIRPRQESKGEKRNT